MNIVECFQIEDPEITISWDIDRDSLIKLFDGREFRKVTNDYYTANCISLGGLQCYIGFHFHNKQGKLKELEFFREDYSNLEASYNEFQVHLESSFGIPKKGEIGYDGFLDKSWSFGKVNIRHFVFERFGPEEHVRIVNNESW